MSVKHQTILPKIWKRRDDGAFTNPHSNKFLQNDPEYMTMKQKQIQINRYVFACCVENISTREKLFVSRM